MGAPDQAEVSWLRRHVTERVTRLQSEHLAQGGWTVAGRLSQLRSAASRQPGDDVRVIRDTIHGLENDRGTDWPTDREQAAHTAVTLFALHLQSAREAVHAQGPSMGDATGRLARRSLSEDAVRARFNALCTAGSWDATRAHLRSLIGLFRDAGISLDYGLLADDLHRLNRPDRALRVRLRWGRDFEKTLTKMEEAAV